MARPLVPSSQKALLLELKGLQEEPVEGFRVTLVDEGDLYNWEVAIFGPPNTYYEGGYFKARLKFPIDYPYSPPAFRFLTKMWHPNIYEDHPPERHLPPQRAQHLLPGQRGRLRDVQEVEREQREGPGVHGHHPEAGPGDQGGCGAGRCEGAHHAGRVLREDQGPGPRRGLGPLLRRLLRGRRGRGRGRQLLRGRRGRLWHRGVLTPRPRQINAQILPRCCVGSGHGEAAAACAGSGVWLPPSRVCCGLSSAPEQGRHLYWAPPVLGAQHVRLGPRWPKDPDRPRVQPR
ncbi:ubiquitin-conjugating enzyme E2 R1 isoform X1 [Pteropus medius]|uniref:ubiquitin-conjugating enzyme E2 R1 isoform X1 n=1 Tax=Pteropus vampyrus TaxID=132908 RepID=UPI00196A9DEF|nr:ubiquitin-conjugating enzyme E2 R1 isoform X1 [Pteropus giganteus]